MELDFTQYVLVLAIIAGATELVTRVRAKDYWVAVTILISVGIGALFGALGYYPELDVVEGAALGFGASGAIATIGARRSTPSPSKDAVAERVG